jgi:hypothetical protein
MTFLFERANPRPGIPALERAHRMLPSRTDISSNLLQLYLAAGERDKAQDLLAGPWTRLADPAVIAAARQALLNFDLDRSNEQLRAGDYLAAVATLREARGRAVDPALTRQIDEQIERLTTFADRKRQSDEINRAVAAANEGDIAAAIAIVDALLPTLKDPDLAEAARNMLDSLRTSERGPDRGPKGNR